MKTIITILILLAFIQASLWPANLGLILILTRSFIRQDKANLFLAFGFGLTFAYLMHLPLGLLSLMNLSFVEAVYIFSKTTFSHSFLFMLPVIGAALVLVELSMGSLNWSKVIVEVFLILPIYLLVRFWEERFIVRPQIRLKV